MFKVIQSLGCSFKARQTLESQKNVQKKDKGSEWGKVIVRIIVTLRDISAFNVVLGLVGCGFRGLQ